MAKGPPSSMNSFANKANAANGSHLLQMLFPASKDDKPTVAKGVLVPSTVCIASAMSSAFSSQTITLPTPPQTTYIGKNPAQPNTPIRHQVRPITLYTIKNNIFLCRMSRRLEKISSCQISANASWIHTNWHPVQVFSYINKRAIPLAGVHRVRLNWSG